VEICDGFGDTSHRNTLSLHLLDATINGTIDEFVYLHPLREQLTGK